MKKRKLEQVLRQLGWRFFKHGRRHEIWTNGVHIVPIPRHTDLNEVTARGIIRNARELNMRR